MHIPAISRASLQQLEARVWKSQMSTHRNDAKAQKTMSAVCQRATDCAVLPRKMLNVGCFWQHTCAPANTHPKAVGSGGGIAGAGRMLIVGDARPE